MIRLLILATSFLRAQTLAQALREDERFDIAAIRTVLPSQPPGPLDVLVTIGLRPAQIPRWNLPVVALANAVHSQPDLARSIYACLPENAPTLTIAAAILAAAQDLVVLTSEQANVHLPPSELVTRDHLEPEPLTHRELQVVRLLASGLGNKQLAEQLNISSHTVKFHVAQILAKLGATTRTEAVSIAIRSGLIPL